MAIPGVSTARGSQFGSKSVLRRFVTFAFLFALLPVLAVCLSGCENVQSSPQQSLVRFIDASYNAPAVDVTVAGTSIASNVGQGTVTGYALLAPSPQAKIVVSADGTTTPLVTSYGTLVVGHEHSVFLTDFNSTYKVVVLEDQGTPAPGGHSEIRFINEAPGTGAVDIYLVPGSSTLADAKIIATVPIGGTAGYITFTSQTVSLVTVQAGVVPTATNSTTTPLPLTGGEVDTALIVDSQLTTTPPSVIIVADDVPAS